ncbi:TniQ family protein [Rhizobacter sp. Root404]|uniref:TniQ family protein n=1 Tax=Rhizobacter sp. Root404 TaxID=1736528 RepID=UPI001F282577|nr:TniQ family protein [Rhizobacter sp. Root404]
MSFSDAWGPPAPYPDELAISVVARHLRNWGYLDRPGFAHSSLGVSNGLSHPCLPGPLARLAMVAFPGIPERMARTAFIRRHTTLPFYLAYESTKRAAYFTELAISYPSRLRLRFRTAASLYGHPRTLRFCPRCMEIETRKLGGGFWHRSHQLPGMTTCEAHELLLFDSQVPFAGQRWNDLRPPSAEVCRADAGLQTRPLFGLALSKSICRAAASAMQRTWASAWVEKDAYRRALRALGLGKFSRLVQASAVRLDFEAWLVANGGIASELGPDRWLEALFTEIKSTPTPIQHLVFRCYLSERFRTTTL